MKSIIHLKDKKNKDSDVIINMKKTKDISKNFIIFWTTQHGFFILVLVFTSSLSFFLGKISGISSTQSLHNTKQKIVYSQSNDNTEVVASKKGSVYHLPWCPGATRMKEENKVFFENSSEAELAGYTPAKNCEGL
jgi:hypothetical protein